MAEVAARDARSTVAGNLRYLATLTHLDCIVESKAAVKLALPVKKVPEKEVWRTGLLDILMRERADSERENKDTRRVNAMLASLCYS